MKVGDVVVLNSGGPEMTVTSAEDNGVVAAWFDGNTLICSQRLPPDALTVQRLGGETPLRDIGLSEEICLMLAGAGVTTAQQLAMLTPASVLRLERVGRITLSKIKKALHEAGFSMMGDD